jgi:hypothetical protein
LTRWQRSGLGLDINGGTHTVTLEPRVTTVDAKGANPAKRPRRIPRYGCLVISVQDATRASGVCRM